MACCHGLARWIVIHPPGCGYPTTSSTLVTPVLGGTDPQNILQFPINILVYHRSFIAPNLAFLVLSVFFLQKRNYVKAYIDEIKYLYGDRFNFSKK